MTPRLFQQDSQGTTKPQNSSDKHDAPPLHIELASAESQLPTHKRPSIPTLIINPLHSDKNSLENKLLVSMITVFSNFDNISVQRGTIHNSNMAYWPEEYEFFLNTFNLDEYILVTSQLVQLTSGRVAHTQTFKLPKLEDDHLSTEKLNIAKEFAAQLVQQNGFVMQDYRSQNNYSPIMNCRLMLERQSQHDQDNTLADIENCISTLKTTDSDSKLQLKTQLQLAIAGESHDSTVTQEALNKALLLAEQARTLNPYNASTYRTLMLISQALEKHEQALEHGKSALNINPFDAVLLNEVSQIMDLLNNEEEANQLREQAKRVQGNAQLYHTELDMN